MTTQRHIESITYCYEELGWAFTPLFGKRPVRPGWQREPRLPLSEVLDYFLRGGNVGLRTGTASGIVVIDLDPGADPPECPPTVAVNTGRGRHLYFRHTDPLRNSTGKLRPHIDLRADGGQVVFPGSKHPDTGAVYEWARSPKDIDLAPLPSWVLEPPTVAPMAPIPTAARNGRGNTYVRASVSMAESNVRNAPEGARNDTLNREAFNLGQFVGGQVLDYAAAESVLLSAALDCGLLDGEARATVASGLRAGLEHPRTGPSTEKPRSGQRSAPRGAETSDARGSVLAPGAHVTADGEIIEQGVGAFAREVLDALPDSLIYRRAGVAGEIVGRPGRRKWTPLGTDRARLMVDEHVKLGAWHKSRENGEQHLAFRYCIRDWGALVVAAAESHPAIRDINIVTPFPVYVETGGSGWKLSPPGYANGVYYDEPDDLRGLEPERDFETIHRTLYELVIDFPFVANADRHNYFGLLLTPIIAPATIGNRPMHLITAPIPRTGKSKLAEDVLGGILTGRKTPAMQITGSDEERDKRIAALLLQDEIIVHLDNLPPKLDSPAIASLLTASVYQSRLLGSSKILSLPNNLVLVGTGNNVECSTEIAKRCVPIRLQPNTPNPERRANFHYPNLWDHVRGSRRSLLACLLGMVENWNEKGRPKSKIRLGGFESWSEAVGGILDVNGLHEWMKNVNDWLHQADSDSAEMNQFVALWAENLGSHWVTTDQILRCIEGSEVFEWIFVRKDPKRMIGRILRNYVGAPIGEHFISKRVTGTGKEYSLCLNRKLGQGFVNSKGDVSDVW